MTENIFHCLLSQSVEILKYTGTLKHSGGYSGSEPVGRQFPGL